MAKTLNFNSIQRPTLLLTMSDEAHTQIKVGTPSEALIREMEQMLPELEPVLTNGDADAIQACYDLAARLINCNRSGVTVTAEELRNKYGIDFENLIIFYSAYFEFIEEITHAKN